MCGIITMLHGSRPVKNELLIERFIRQRERGTQGFGFTYLTPKGYLRTMRFEDEAMCFYNLASVKSRLIMLHHRRPTSTKNIAAQNHPICCKTDKGYYCLVHNGVISNAAEIKRLDHREIKYSTEGETDFNDSETLLHELVRNIETGEKLRCYGSMAFVLLVADNKRKFIKLHYGRNAGSPLYHAVWNDDTEIISSQNESMDIKDIVKENHLATIQFNKKKIDFEGEIATIFPTYSDLYVPPRRTYEAPKEKTLSDGSILRKGRVEPNQHQKYIDMLELVESYNLELKAKNKENTTDAELQGILKDIDLLIQDCNNSSQTRRIVRAKEELLTHRNRLLPDAPPATALQESLLGKLAGKGHSLFNRLRISTGEPKASDPANGATTEGKAWVQVRPPSAIESIHKDAISSLARSRYEGRQQNSPKMSPAGITQEEFLDRLDSGMYG